MQKLNKKEKLYYAAIDKTTYIIYIATTKVGIARLLGISYDSIRRYLSNPLEYSDKNYIIQKDVPINKGIRKPKPFKWH